MFVVGNKWLGRFKKDGIWIAVAAVALFLFLSLASYDARDVEYPREFRVRNYAGKAGVVAAANLFMWLGVVAYGIPLGLSFLWVLRRKHVHWGWTMWISWMVAFLGWSCLLVSYFEKASFLSDRMPSYGGLLGMFCITLIRGRFGNSATAVIVLGGWLMVAFWGYTLWLEDPEEIDEFAKSDNHDQVDTGHRDVRATGPNRHSTKPG